MNRMLMNDVRKRLSNICSAEGTYGVWARYDGGRLSGTNAYENDFHTLQFGIDTVPVADAPRFGVAFSYTKSDATVRGGDVIHGLDGADTWYEYGIGANFNLNKNTYVYADVERTSGGALDEDWRANIGVRYSF